MHMKMYHRTNCRLCYSKNVDMVVKLEPIPLPDNYGKTSNVAKEA